ncbi:MAG: hypothetical protein D6788_03050 [Planctomycetota bacterium]|nr:MAG: hypothetical protein D6788_03050 [Planctomycetota bacterium]
MRPSSVSQLSAGLLLLWNVGTLSSLAQIANPSQPPRVAVVRGSLPTYRQIAEAVESSLREHRCECRILELVDARDAQQVRAVLTRIEQLQPDVVVTTGQRTTAVLIPRLPHVPVVFTAVPNIADTAFRRGPGAAPVLGVSADAAPHQRLNAILETLPKTRRVAVLYSTQTKRTTESLVEAGAPLHVQVVGIEAGKDRFPVALQALESARVDGVLMLLDPAVYNAHTIRALLLWGARHRVPVFAFCRNIVKAGAYGGQFFDAQRLGRQTAELVMDFLQGTLPLDERTQYARDPAMALNRHTAEIIALPFAPHAVGPDVEILGGME